MAAKLRRHSTRAEPNTSARPRCLATSGPPTQPPRGSVATIVKSWAASSAISRPLRGSVAATASTKPCSLTVPSMTPGKGRGARRRSRQLKATEVTTRRWTCNVSKHPPESRPQCLVVLSPEAVGPPAAVRQEGRGEDRTCMVPQRQQALAGV